ncbi:MAG TPA: LPS export ABC transporter ATP-binding protein [bacterium]|nr:LPS export ABC transporter ATP-binding protein [bacterium]HOL47035.1 LPS export ABC transporter ATP-binding protein [bacterium]HPQ18463.1 LPS export ABC transporter ATP-binding protein [bacterium]
MNRELIVKNLRKLYKKREVVRGISMNLKQGEIVGLLGPNGAGKTTTFYMIVGLIKPNDGSIYLDNEDITNLPMYQRARKGIGYLPQESSVFRKLTVEENILAVLEFTNLSKKERKEIKDKLIEEMNIAHIAKNLGTQLSGGERRRVEIARALVLNPSFLLLDEPFAGVDPIRVIDIQNIIKKLKEKNIGVLITDHKVRETLEVVDRAYMISDGEIFLSGDANKLANDPTAREIYLGHNFTL